MNSTRFLFEVNPALPPALSRLAELATNLRFSWHRPTRTLFSSLDPGLWREVGGNPRVFLRCVEQSLLDRAASDAAYLERYKKVLAGYDTYLSESPLPDSQADADTGLVAYFCAEYGFHESFQIYSGGLGVLAGDYCKTASDLALPFVAVGLLYTEGYFTQTIDREGNQVAHYREHGRDDLPVEPALDRSGQEVRIICRLAGRDVHARVWQAKVGRVSVYLLDTNLGENSPGDREITHKLYGGDVNIRIQQEILLGIGGAKALRALGLEPSVWHINEGHAAFLIIELIREQVARGLDFASAREAVAASCVFTTHTPVAAGHDVFSPDLVLGHLGELVTELKIDADTFLRAGRAPRGGDQFNMTRLALNGSRHHNGVSRIHGGISARIVADNWPEVPPEDNPIGYITNGVHLPTFLFQPWAEFFDRSLGQTWRARLNEEAFWQRLYETADESFWEVKQAVKVEVLQGLRARLQVQCAHNNVSDAHYQRLTRFLNPANPNVLTVGFARRFATYKRATLLFNDIARLASIVGNPERPVIFVFAGKSHPADEPARKLLRDVNTISMSADFFGRVIFVEDYDMALARLLVAGVDVWLNNPISPLEASGTSGIKAAINGTLNLSVLDGWWAEGFDGENGWSIVPADAGNEQERDREDAQTLYELLEDEVIPLYYSRNEQGFSPGWVARSKRSMATIIPHFNMRPVLENYVTGLYRPAARCARALAQDAFAGAKTLAAWKEKVRRGWGRVALRRLDTVPQRIDFGGRLRTRVAAFLDGLDPADVRVELVLRRELPDGSGQSPRYTSFGAGDGSRGVPGTVCEPFAFTGERDSEGSHVFGIDSAPPWCGKISAQVRIVPHHALLSHPYEMGLMKWM
ncbi:MAG TPA: alpha-glucan family phosphorylase [Steroidobacteraceae bacterium]|nr:alpha-glucan family phosphorylase [Steroidobacteraceae bacterium]